MPDDRDDQNMDDFIVFTGSMLLAIFGSIAMVHLGLYA